MHSNSRISYDVALRWKCSQLRAISRHYLRLLSTLHAARENQRKFQKKFWCRELWHGDCSLQTVWKIRKASKVSRRIARLPIQTQIVLALNQNAVFFISCYMFNDPYVFKSKLHNTNTLSNFISWNRKHWREFHRRLSIVVWKRETKIREKNPIKRFSCL